MHCSGASAELWSKALKIEVYIRAQGGSQFVVGDMLDSTGHFAFCQKVPKLEIVNVMLWNLGSFKKLLKLKLVSIHKLLECRFKDGLIYAK
jgi:hypothetical protein